MEPVALSAMTATIEDPAEELQDFDRVVQLYRPVVFRFMLASLRDRDDAESLTQDCFLRAFRHRSQFRGDAAVKTWLMQIAANLVRDLTRSRRFQFWKRAQSSAARAHDLTDFLSCSDASPETRALVEEKLRSIWTATAKLSERQRAVFALRFVEDMNLLEIGEVLNMKEGTVKKHLFRALHAVREHTRRLS
jgi:RNA polymerase sigma-70 factor (ECF subfamily)